MTQLPHDDDVLNLGTFADTLGTSLDDLDSEDVTLACFVVDASSSMASVASAVIEAYNAELRALRGARTATEILVSTITFADAPTCLHGYSKVADAPLLDAGSYRANGSTALYDAVLDAFARLTAYRTMLLDNGVRSRAIVTVLSDGEDNVSQKRALDVKQAATKLLRDEGTVLAFAAFGDPGTRKALAGVAAQLGFPSVITASHSPAEIRRVLGQVSQSLARPAAAAPWP
jgi:hypothetical protein